MINQQTQHDIIDHPNHYQRHSRKLDCTIECRRDLARHMSYDLGNMVKYVFRHQSKNQPEIDLQKAANYADDMHERDNTCRYTTSYQHTLKRIHQYCEALADESPTNAETEFWQSVSPTYDEHLELWLPRIRAYPESMSKIIHHIIQEENL